MDWFERHGSIDHECFHSIEHEKVYYIPKQIKMLKKENPQTNK